MSLKDPAGSESSIITSQSNINFNVGSARIVFHFEDGEVKLWYPVGYGEQPLYEVQVRIYDDVRSLLIVKKLLLLRSSLKQGQLMDSKTQRVGFRRVRIVEDKLVDLP